MLTDTSKAKSVVMYRYSSHCGMRLFKYEALDQRAAAEADTSCGTGEDVDVDGVGAMDLSA